MTKKSRNGDERGTMSKRRKRTKTRKNNSGITWTPNKRPLGVHFVRVCVCVNLLACSVSLRDRQETGRERGKEEEDREEDEKKKKRNRSHQTR